ncbi:hypothetical protein [Rhodococcus qingshengii]|uniref:hypothetical protein n=1 Tax=Rhodococcus qingshengii TaxID=334542 RepID=UPI0035DEE408
MQSQRSGSPQSNENAAFQMRIHVDIPEPRPADKGLPTGIEGDGSKPGNIPEDPVESLQGHLMREPGTSRVKVLCFVCEDIRAIREYMKGYPVPGTRDVMGILSEIMMVRNIHDSGTAALGGVQFVNYAIFNDDFSQMSLTRNLDFHNDTPLRCLQNNLLVTEVHIVRVNPPKEIRKTLLERNRRNQRTLHTTRPLRNLIQNPVHHVPRQMAFPLTTLPNRHRTTTPTRKLVIHIVKITVCRRQTDMILQRMPPLQRQNEPIRKKRGQPEWTKRHRAVPGTPRQAIGDTQEDPVQLPHRDPLLEPLRDLDASRKTTLKYIGSIGEHVVRDPVSRTGDFPGNCGEVVSGRDAQHRGPAAPHSAQHLHDAIVRRGPA